MEGGQDYLKQDTEEIAQSYGADQYGTLSYAQAGIDPGYAGYNYYENSIPKQANEYSTMNSSTKSGGWYSQEAPAYASYYPQYKPTTQTNDALYKTKLCRHFQTKGHCNMGDKCSFAHGVEELKQSIGGGTTTSATSSSYVSTPTSSTMYQQKPYYSNPSNSKYYKTVLCRNFQETGQWQFGDKCKFAHGYEDIKPLSTNTTQQFSAYNSYAKAGIYNSGYYATDASQMNMTGLYGYDLSYSYPEGEALSGAYSAPAPTASHTFDAVQNYGYNYTPDSQYLQGYDYGTNTLSSATTLSTGSDTMNQYYAQSDMINSKAYTSSGQ